MLQPQPIPKKSFYRLQRNVGFPFPNFGIPSDEIPILCRCYQDEKGQFFVSHEQDIPTLYRNGAFGHSSITFRSPLCLQDGISFEKSPYFRKRFHKHNKSKESPSDTAPILPETFSQSTNELEETNVNEEEKLLLFPEEVIFLSFGIGCISIFLKLSTTDTTNYFDVWKDLVKMNSEFPYLYAVYHHFRSKNWIPKIGNQYGGDYVLYELGPDFYHSTYVVYIQGLPTRPRLSWLQLHSLLRVAVSANKTVLLCEVQIPLNFTPLSPRCIFDLKIHETVISRWTPFGRVEVQED